MVIKYITTESDIKTSNHWQQFKSQVCIFNFKSILTVFSNKFWTSLVKDLDSLCSEGFCRPIVCAVEAPSFAHAALIVPNALATLSLGVKK